MDRTTNRTVSGIDETINQSAIQTPTRLQRLNILHRNQKPLTGPRAPNPATARVIPNRGYNFEQGITIPNGPENDEQRALRLHNFKITLNSEYARKNKLTVPKFPNYEDKQYELEIQDKFHEALCEYWENIFERKLFRISNPGTSSSNLDHEIKKIEEFLVRQFGYKILRLDMNISRNERQILEGMEKSNPKRGITIGKKTNMSISGVTNAQEARRERERMGKESGLLEPADSTAWSDLVMKAKRERLNGYVLNKAGAKTG